ncbi:MAG: PAS domain S-box protein [Thermodesulfobacteriota bacterium]
MNEGLTPNTTSRDGGSPEDHPDGFSDYRYRRIFESLEDLYYEIDSEERIRVLSPSCYRLTGWKPEELIGMPVRYVYVNPKERDRILSTLRRDGFTDNFITRLRRKDGTIIPVSINARLIYDENGEPDGVSGMIRDITKILAAEERLKESELKFRTLAEACPFGILIYQNDCWVYANPAAERISGYRLEELVGSTFWDMVHPEDRDMVITRGKARQRGENPQNAYEFRIIDKNGILKWVLLTGVTIHYQGEPAGLIAVIDITERKRIEQERETYREQLHRSQKMESVGLLAGGIAHDLNNLLQPMMGYCELLLLDPALEERTRRYVRKFMETSEKAKDLVRRLMAFGMNQQLDIHPVNLNRIIRDFIDLIARSLREDIRIITDLNDSIPRILADPGQVEQVIMNLAVNAQDAMPQGGTLILRTHLADPTETDFLPTESLIGKQAVRMTVCDTGMGMDAETCARIFDPFFTTKEMGKGTGLGLAMVYGIVTQHGGRIRVRSEVGKGTIFDIDWPVAAPAKQPIPSESVDGDEVDTLIGGTETILLAEDNEFVREFAANLITRLGYRVLSASSPESCLDLARSEATIDLLLTDVIMPEMSGNRLYEHVASLHPGIRILYMSGHPEETIRRHGILTEEAALIQKPFTLHSLAARIRDVLDRR